MDFVLSSPHNSPSHSRSSGQEMRIAQVLECFRLSGSWQGGWTRRCNISLQTLCCHSAAFNRLQVQVEGPRAVERLDCWQPGAVWLAIAQAAMLWPTQATFVPSLPEATVPLAVVQGLPSVHSVTAIGWAIWPIVQLQVTQSRPGAALFTATGSAIRLGLPLGLPCPSRWCIVSSSWRLVVCTGRSSSLLQLAASP